MVPDTIFTLGFLAPQPRTLLQYISILLRSVEEGKVTIVAKPGKKTLLSTQRNNLFAAIQDKKFSVSHFDLTEDGDGAIVKRRETNYSFLIEPTKDEDYEDPYYQITASPGRELLQEDWKADNWSNVLDGFNYWLDCLSSELEAPDLWAAVAGDTHLIKLAANQDNAPFTSGEQLQVKNALSEIKAYLIASHKLSGSRLDATETRLTYLEESASRMGRKDWLHVSIGVLANIATSIALGGNDTRELFRLAGQVFKQFLGTILYLAGPH